MGKLTPADQKAIDLALEHLAGKHDPRFISRTFLLHGDPGIGKTYYMHNLLKSVSAPIVYLGSGSFPFSHTKCDTLAVLYKKINKNCIVFIDDFTYQEIEGEDFEDEFSFPRRRMLFRIIERIQDQDSLLFITLNDIHLDSAIFDRLHVKITFPLPTPADKKAFLKERFGDCLTEAQCDHLADHTAGYNYRDLTELLRVAYRTHEEFHDIDTALREYIPTALRSYRLVRPSHTLKAIINPAVRRVLQNVRFAAQYPERVMEFGIKRMNLLLFQGPPGTGKTFAAEALAGELNYPLLNFRAVDLYNGSPFSNTESLITTARRFQKCVILIDEADKVLGRGTLGEDGALQGTLQSALDGIDDAVNAIIVLSVNNPWRFGHALRQRLCIVHFAPPGDAQRRAFLEDKINHHPLLQKDQLLAVVRHTKNFTFRDLEWCWNRMVFQKLEGELSEDNIRRIVEEMQQEHEQTVSYG